LGIDIDGFFPHSDFKNDGVVCADDGLKSIH
jgi:hypothetical protein